MRLRGFGESGLSSSVIGFGGWPMGRGQYGDFDDDEAVAAVRRAYERGVTLFDTAAAYGWGYGETLMGRAVAPFRSDIVLVTKGGRRRVVDYMNRYRGEVNDSSREFLLREIDASLKRLNTHYIDLYLLHWPDRRRPFDVPLRVLDDAKRAGKIRHYGVSNFSARQLLECMKHGSPVCDQVGYHVFDRRPESEILPLAQARGFGIMAYGSLAHGLLTAQWRTGHMFGDYDWRGCGRHFGLATWAEENLPKNLAVIERLRALAADHGKTVAQLAIAWVLAGQAITVALCGAKRPEEIEENIGGDWAIPPSLRAEIDRLVLALGAGFGKADDPGP
jgi:aryl-alcohol dehydrogenase-like predicted oxidoreductase